MQFWINKETDEIVNNEWSDAYIYSLKRKKYSTIFTNITDVWYRMDCLALSAIYEDLFIIGLSVFSIDKRLSRSKFLNNWTREISVSIPVLEYEKWVYSVEQWNRVLSFLTGDIWDIHFRKSNVLYSKRDTPNRKHLSIAGCDCVSLFSGGLDSFCGAIKLLEEGRSPCLIGHNEYPKLRTRQGMFVDSFKSLYNKQKVKFISFSANSRAPHKSNGEILDLSENTSRGRSLLFLCAALSIASILDGDMPVYIPENGFIGLNLPLTNSRKGTCSTRTTHPYFLSSFQEILEQVGIRNKIVNFYAFSTKRELVQEVMDKEAFLINYRDTISCSHPCLPRYNRDGNTEYPINCGYCYPCLIRKSSLLDIPDDKYSFAAEKDEFVMKYSGTAKIHDLNAVVSSIYRYEKLDDAQIAEMIRYAGNLDDNQVNNFIRVYKSTMNDLQELFSK